MTVETVPVTDLAAVIRDHWETWSEVGGPVVDRTLFGTDDADDVASMVDTWCRDHLGSGIASARRWTASVGSVAVVDLADGTAAAIKVHQANRSRRFLRGVHQIQQAVAAAGIAAPLPRAGPAPIRDGGPLATAESVLPDPGFTDGRAPGAAQTAATALATATRATAALRLDIVGAHPQRTPPGRLWPIPHSPIFDFEATAAGAEWIDEVGRRALAVLEPAAGGPPRLVHHDWCSRNVRVVDGAVVAAYDWDSVSPMGVAAAAGQAAALWPCTGEADSPDASTPEEIDAFLDAFASAWGEPLDDQARRLAHARAQYVIAYSARCEHAIGREGSGIRALRGHAVGSS
jgi:Ser/Thr protein kinase RdoA (MazF antagonist)